MDGAPQPVDPAYAAESNVTNLWVIFSVFMALALITVALRLYVRIFMIRAMGPDDYAIAVALALCIVNYGTNVGKFRYGSGRHVTTISPSDMKFYNHIQFFQSTSFVAAICCIKVSVAFLLIRLAPKPLYKRFLWGIIVFVICFTIACLGTLIFFCVPVAGAWDPEVAKTAKCYSMTTFARIGLFNTCINVITDVIMATLPVPLIWQLKMNQRTKISLIIILGMGYFACAAGIVKGVKQANYLSLTDVTFWEEIQIWSFIQICIGVATACFPTLKPIFKSVIGDTHAVKSSNPNSVNAYATNRSRAQGGIELSSRYRKGVEESDDALDKGYDVRIHAGSVKSDIESANQENDAGSSSRSSQDVILPKKLAVMKTTEVTVQHAGDRPPIRHQSSGRISYGGVTRL